MKQQEFYIGDRNLTHGKDEFIRAISELSKQVTAERLEELDETLTTETLRDLVHGRGSEIQRRMQLKMKSSLKGLIFPAERRKRQELFDILAEQLTGLCREVEYILRFFRNMPVEAYCIDENGSIGFDERVVDQHFDVQKRIYISDPQQIEVYKLAKQVQDAVSKLSEILPKYGMHVSNVLKYNRMSEEVSLSPEMICEAYEGGSFIRDWED